MVGVTVNRAQGSGPFIKRSHVFADDTFSFTFVMSNDCNWTLSQNIKEGSVLSSPKI